MIRVALILFSAVAVPLIADEKKSMRDETTDALKQAFHFSPVPETAPEQTDQEAAPAVVLERLTVVQSFERRQLEQSIQAHEERAKEEKFTWKHGGALLGKGPAQIGIWPGGGGFIFLKIRW